MKIKGTFLKDYVKIVRATRDKDWERFLLPEDWEIINAMIIPTQYYTAETMGRIAQGLYELLSGSSHAFIRRFGRTQAPEYLSDVMSFILKGEVEAGLKAFATIADRYVDEISVTVEQVGDKGARICYHPVDGAPSFEHYREVQAGFLEWIAQANGARNPRADFISEQRAGGQALIITLEWD
jgi:hypothetical protein